MEKIKIHAGDFLEGYGYCDDSSFVFPTEKIMSFSGVLGVSGFRHERVPFTKLDVVDIATEKNVKKLGGTVVWGAVGELVLGPVGLLAGLLLGGKNKEVTFVAKFKGGRKLLASADSKTFIKIQAAVF